MDAPSSYPSSHLIYFLVLKSEFKSQLFPSSWRMGDWFQPNLPSHFSFFLKFLIMFPSIPRLPTYQCTPCSSLSFNHLLSLRYFSNLLSCKLRILFADVLPSALLVAHSWASLELPSVVVQFWTSLRGGPPSVPPFSAFIEGSSDSLPLRTGGESLSRANLARNPCPRGGGFTWLPHPHGYHMVARAWAPYTKRDTKYCEVLFREVLFLFFWDLEKRKKQNEVFDVVTSPVLFLDFPLFFFLFLLSFFIVSIFPLLLSLSAARSAGVRISFCCSAVPFLALSLVE